MKLLLMSDHKVGLEITRWLLKNYKDDLALVVTISENAIFSAVRDAGTPCLVFESTDKVCEYIYKLKLVPDLGMLAWWPNIVKQPLLGIAKYGIINTHPSLLPYNRGKHYNFWALMEQVPFGVSLHYIDKSVDTGDIVAQAIVPYDWEDNGATLYKKASEAIAKLFKETYPMLRTLNIPTRKQDLSCGSFHLAKELDEASSLDIDKEYCARNLLNLIRARTFPGHPACWFSDDGEEYEIRVQIQRKGKVKTERK